MRNKIGMSLAVISRTRRIGTRVLVAANGADWEAAATDTRAPASGKAFNYSSAIRVSERNSGASIVN